MAKVKMPVLAGTIPLFEKLMSRLENLRDRNPELAPAIQAGLSFAYKYYNKMDNTSAYVVSMCQSLYLLILTRYHLIIADSYSPTFSHALHRKALGAEVC